MTKQIPSYLKLVTDTNTEAPTLVSEDLAAIAELGAAFEQATGWRLEVGAPAVANGQRNLMWSAPVNPGVGISPGHIRLISVANRESDATPRVPLDEAAVLAGAVGNLWGELVATRHALWQREAELAAGVPLIVRDDEESPPLGERLEAVLRGGCEALDCDAVALYLLDSATSELKLRSSWGLPRKRLAAPARPLRGALGDLEALLGHAVVLTGDELREFWKVPEEGFASCICVPVASPSMPLGTLWAYSRQPRDFSDAQTNIFEVVAGRVASDLERQVLLDEAIVARRQLKLASVDGRSQHERLPTIPPVVDGWDVAARAHHAGQVGGTFYDWFALDDGSLAVLAGDALAHGVAGALTATALRAAGRAFGTEPKSVQCLLEKSNSILWSCSAGNEFAGLFQAHIDPRNRHCIFASAGPLRVLAISGDDATALAGPNTPLGWQEDSHLAEMRHAMHSGDLLVVYGTSYLSECDELTLATLDASLATALASGAKLPAKRLTELADQALQLHAEADDDADRVLLVIKRRGR